MNRIFNVNVMGSQVKLQINNAEYIKEFYNRYKHVDYKTIFKIQCHRLLQISKAFSKFVSTFWWMTSTSCETNFENDQDIRTRSISGNFWKKRYFVLRNLYNFDVVVNLRWRVTNKNIYIVASFANCTKSNHFRLITVKFTACIRQSENFSPILVFGW